MKFLLAARKSCCANPLRFDSTGQWLIFADEQGVGAELARQLTGAGQVPRVVRRGTSSLGSVSETWIDPNNVDEYKNLLQQAG